MDKDEPEDSANLPAAMQKMADDLGLDRTGLQSFDLGQVFKQGPTSALFLTRISHIYSENTTYQNQIAELQSDNKELSRKLNEKENECTSLQKALSVLRVRYDLLSSTGQNSILSTVLFALGSLATGVCGTFISSSDYQSAVISGVIGVSLSVFAASLIITKRPKEEGHG